MEYVTVPPSPLSGSLAETRVTVVPTVAFWKQSSMVSIDCLGINADQTFLGIKRVDIKISLQNLMSYNVKLIVFDIIICEEIRKLIVLPSLNAFYRPWMLISHYVWQFISVLRLKSISPILVNLTNMS